jgi:hypothetical protein
MLQSASPAPSRVLACSIVVALLLSTQYLAQLFVWQHWPVDEVMAGWLEVARDRVVVAVAIALALIAAARFPAATQWRRSVLLAAAILAGASAGELILVAGGSLVAPNDAAAVASRVGRWSVVAGSVAAMSHMWRSAAEAAGAAQAIELRRAQLERQAAEARLAALRGQIEPHFLFNTLATVRRLHQVDPGEGELLLAHFVDYLRLAQPGRQGEGTTLGQEVALTRAYLGVAAARMNGRLQVHIDVPDELRDQPFPPLTLATLAENAVKHGIAPLPGGGEIAVRVRQAGQWLEAVVVDTGVGFSGASGSGIGLANIRARLQTLYGQAGTLTLHANRPTGVRAAMRLPGPPIGATR